MGENQIQFNWERKVCKYSEQVTKTAQIGKFELELSYERDEETEIGLSIQLGTFQLLDELFQWYEGSPEKAGTERLEQVFIQFYSAFKEIQ